MQWSQATATIVITTIKMKKKHSKAVEECSSLRLVFGRAIHAKGLCALFLRKLTNLFPSDAMTLRNRSIRFL